MPSPHQESFSDGKPTSHQKDTHMISCILVAGSVFMTDGRTAISTDAIASMSFERGFVQHKMTVSTMGGKDLILSIPGKTKVSGPIAILDDCIKGAKENGKEVVGEAPS
jgi:hypothetical protein